MAAKRPLDGIRVLDFTSMIAGPYCTRLLADCGADVIKVEAPGGDFMRQTPPQRDGRSSYFGHLNAGKKSLVLDLKTPAGHDRAVALAARADVLVENFRPGVMAGLGLSYGELCAVNPDLVYCSISGFGQDGPRAKQAAYAPIVHALSGMDLTQMGYQDELTRPEKSGIFTADYLAAIYGFGAIQTALVGKFRHGGGQFIDVALLEGVLSMLVLETQLLQFGGELKRNFYEPTRTSDGFIIVTPINQKNFEQMADAMDRKEWREDPRFATIAARRDNWRALMDGIEAWTSQRTAAEAEEILMAAGVPCSRYRLLQEALDDPQLAHRGFFKPVRDGSGTFNAASVPFQFSDDSVHVNETVPELGADSEAILAELDG